MNQNITGKLADVIRAWAKDQPKYAEVPANADLAANLDYVATDTAWTIARNHLIEQGVIGKDGSHYYVQ